MYPRPGQYVKLMFNNGHSAEGWVKDWSDKKSVLFNRERTSYLVIQRTEETVLFVKIMADAKQLPTRPKDEVADTFNEIAEKPIKSRQDLKTLAELKAELNKIEREELALKLRSHQPSNITPVQYAIPKFFTQPSPLQHSFAKGPRTRIPTNPRMRPMLEDEDEDQ